MKKERNARLVLCTKGIKLETDNLTYRKVIEFMKISDAYKTVMPFGKYKGKTLEEIPLGYLRWLCENEEGFNKELIIAADMVLSNEKRYT